MKKLKLNKEVITFLNENQKEIKGGDNTASGFISCLNPLTGYESHCAPTCETTRWNTSLPDPLC